MKSQISKSLRVAFVILAIVGLCLVYILQRFNYAGLLFDISNLELFNSENTIFTVNRTARLLINDSLCMLLIYALFQNTRYLRLAGLLFLFELLVVLPAYLFLKLRLEGASELSSPLLSPVHRMIVNPLLMIVLIAAFYYQQYVTARSDG